MLMYLGSPGESLKWHILLSNSSKLYGGRFILYSDLSYCKAEEMELRYVKLLAQGHSALNDCSGSSLTPAT